MNIFYIISIILIAAALVLVIFFGRLLSGCVLSIVAWCLMWMPPFILRLKKSPGP